jgi:hypothetical protein
MKKKKGLPVHLPENFHAEHLLEKYPFSPARKRNIKAQCYYILNTIYQMSLSREWRKYYEEEGGYPLHSDIMNQILGNSYVEVLQILEAESVIVRLDSYQAGMHSKLVCLTPSYESAAIKVREIDEGTPVAKKLKLWQQQKEKQEKKALHPISYITKWFDASSFHVDEKELHTFIEFYRHFLQKKLKSFQGKDKQKLQSKINNRYNSMLRNIESLLQGEMRLSRTGKDHRLHSFLSNMKKELRQLITYNGEPLVSIDIKSCQPYLLTYLLQAKNWEKIVQLFNSSYFFSSSSSSIPSSSHIMSLYSSLLMSGLFSETQDSKGLQTKKNQKNVWEDDFYLFIMNKAMEENKEHVFPDKKTTKKKIMNILFDTGTYMWHDEAKQLFMKWIPKEGAFIEKVHSISRLFKVKKSKCKNERVNLLPIMLQRIESMLVLEHVCRVISEELPDAPLLPVHDCIYTTPPYADLVKNIMERELTAEVGVKPGIKVEYADRQKMQNELELLADNDWLEILENKRKNRLKTGKKSNQSVTGSRTPLLKEIPKRGDKQILSTRYVSEA